MLAISELCSAINGLNYSFIVRGATTIQDTLHHVRDRPNGGSCVGTADHGMN